MTTDDPHASAGEVHGQFEPGTERPVDDARFGRCKECGVKLLLVTHTHCCGCGRKADYRTIFPSDPDEFAQLRGELDRLRAEHAMLLTRYEMLRAVTETRQMLAKAKADTLDWRQVALVADEVRAIRDKASRALSLLAVIHDHAHDAEIDRGYDRS